MTRIVEENSTMLRIGDFVTWRSHLYVLRGIDPMSVAGRRADLEGCGTGERRRAHLEELLPAPRGVR